MTPEGGLYADDFTDPGTGWPNGQVFGNYYIGYHEPEWYHVDVSERNDRVVAALPQQTFDDVTVESQVFVSEANTAPEGHFRYGLALRRSGNQFYAFTVSPRAKSWTVLKSTGTGVEVLDEGTSELIQGLGEKADQLRVDARGSDFTFLIGGEVVSQVSESEYASGQAGFFVETFDSPHAHIHYDLLLIRKVEMSPLPGVLYADDFTDPGTGWPNGQVFGNYYIGYHEPEWYHVDVSERNDRVVAALPQQTFDDITVESQVSVSEANTAPEGDFRYGLALRRSGNQFYAFTVSPRAKSWTVLKSTGTGVEVLDEGTSELIQGLGEKAGQLRVDARGSDFTFLIGGEVVSQVSEPEYASGQVGFFVQTFDSPRASINYDSLLIREVDPLPP
jgi:hypothetical protein